MIYLQIFMGFMRAGLLCFGGGPASIPFVHREAVLRYGWMDEEAFADMVAIANTLPGPINTKMAGYIGMNVGGFFGAMAAVCASILPTAAMLVALGGVLRALSDYPVVIGITRAIVPVVGVMLGVMGWQFLHIAAKSLGWLVSTAHVAVAVVLIWFLGLHPAIVLGGIFAWIFFSERFLAKKSAP